MRYKQIIRVGRVLKLARDLFIAGVFYGSLSIICFAIIGLDFLGFAFFGAFLTAWAAAYYARNLVKQSKRGLSKPLRFARSATPEGVAGLQLSRTEQTSKVCDVRNTSRCCRTAKAADRKVRSMVKRE